GEETEEVGEASDRLSDEQTGRQLVCGGEERAQAGILQRGWKTLAILLEMLGNMISIRQVTRALQGALAVVDRGAAGDVAQHRTVTRRDERGVLQQGIESMGTTLRDLVGGILDGVTQIASAAEELSAV
ncbi:methyl-accepting chemotaxis protein, partial [Pseudomonas ogarae]